MSAFAARLEGTGEFVDAQALSPEGTFVRCGGEGRLPVTDGPFPETRDLIAGWMVIDVESNDRALELAAELSAAPGAGGRPIHERDGDPVTAARFYAAAARSASGLPERDHLVLQAARLNAGLPGGATGPHRSGAPRSG